MMANNPIIVEQTCNASVDKVWHAITNPSQMRQWFFEEIKDFKPEVGFETRFTVMNAGKIYLHLWKILDVNPGKSIKYDWRYAGYPGQGFVTFELIPRKDSTKLRITNEGLETFPRDNPDFSRESCTAGWKYFIQRLKEFMEKDK